MRSWRKPAAGLIALLAVLGTFAPAARADDGLLDLVLFRLRNRLRVTAFLLGRLEPNTDRFIAHNGRDSDENRRDSVLMIEFSEPISLAREIPGNWSTPLAHVNERTIRIGTATGPGVFTPAAGSFYAYVEKAFDPQQGFVPLRIHRHRILFDPNRRFDDPSLRTFEGFDANTVYSVTVLGSDIGARRTVRARDGARIGTTFTTTFRTGDEYFQDYVQPRVVGVEADDAPGVPLEGRTDVDPDAALVVRFSEAMRPESFVPGSTLGVRHAYTGEVISGSVSISADRRVVTYRPEPNLGYGPRDLEVFLTRHVEDLAGNWMGDGVAIRFLTRPGPASPE